MGQVTAMVNGRPYVIACDDGQEGRIRRLVQYVDARVGDFVKGNGQVGEARLLLLAALVIADDLSEANEAHRLLSEEADALRRAQLRRESERRPPDGVPSAASQAARRGIEAAAERIEAIAARLESP